MSPDTRTFTVPHGLWLAQKSRFTPARVHRMESAVARRSGHFRLALQDVHDPHNTAASLRSAEAFGVQFIDMIATVSPKINPGYQAKLKRLKLSNASRGAAQWLTITYWASIAEYHAAMTQMGIGIVIAKPSGKGIPSMTALDLAHPMAVVFGNEHRGIDSSWEQSALAKPFTIPTVGMVESLNVSVAIAVALSHLTLRGQNELAPPKYLLSTDAQQRILDHWTYESLPKEHQDYLKTTSSL